MDSRPKQRIWSGEHYDSDNDNDNDDDERPRSMSFETDSNGVEVKAEM